MRIAMVCDFFFPQEGGIEIHIFQIAQQLVALGHHVIIITHGYGERAGVRYLDSGVKVYYAPIFVVYRGSTFPTIFGFFPYFRDIVLRERIEVVHGHATLSALCHEAIIHARTLGLATVFTDHSLFGFTNIHEVAGSKILKMSLSDVDHVICVSHTGRENTVLRGALDPSRTSVIPNAVISSNFLPKPDFTLKDDVITIVVCSRLYGNKGADLLVAAIPRVCEADPAIRVLIAGDGPKIVDLQQMCEKYQLQDRVQLVGGIRHTEVRDFMVQGEIFLHPTLTEAFGTVIVEAASCGLLVVTTNVGGIPEVLPEKMTVYSETSASALVKSILRAIKMLRTEEVDPSTFHDEIAAMYNWRDVAIRTKKVYDQAIASETNKETVFERIQRHFQVGPFVGILFVISIVTDTILSSFFDVVYPRDSIIMAAEYPNRRTTEEPQTHIENTQRNT